MTPPYFDCYLDAMNKELPFTYQLRPDVRPLIRVPRTRLVFAESSVLYQLINIINKTHLISPEIITKVEEKSHTYYGFGYNITHIYLQKYTLDCTRIICFNCGRS